jgi:hypothetical protein
LRHDDGREERGNDFRDSEDNPRRDFRTFPSLLSSEPHFLAFQDAGDVAYEEEILRNPFSLRGWQRYIEHKTKTGSSKAVCLLYERALKQLPGSYKLWYKYLKYRRRLLAEKCPTEVGYEHLNNVYERALVFMYKVTMGIARDS